MFELSFREVLFNQFLQDPTNVTYRSSLGQGGPLAKIFIFNQPVLELLSHRHPTDRVLVFNHLFRVWEPLLVNPLIQGFASPFFLLLKISESVGHIGLNELISILELLNLRLLVSNLEHVTRGGASIRNPC